MDCGWNSFALTPTTGNNVIRNVPIDLLWATLMLRYFLNLVYTAITKDRLGAIILFGLTVIDTNKDYSGSQKWVGFIEKKKMLPLNPLNANSWSIVCCTRMHMHPAVFLRLILNDWQEMSWFEVFTLGNLSQSWLSTRGFCWVVLGENS